MADQEEKKVVPAAATATAPKAFSFKTPKLNTGGAASGAGAGAAASAMPDDPEAEVDIKVVPLVKLTPVDMPTGEEEEEAMLEVRAKMFVWGEGNAGFQWKERGVGPVKLLKHKGTGVTRLLMRRDQTLKMCANHRLSKEMILENKMGTDRAWAYSCFADYSDAPEVKRITCALRFKNNEIADSFSQLFNDSRDANIAIGGDDDEGAAVAPASDPAVDELAAGVEKLDTKAEDTK
eukprot:m.416133 g.416133  ORF g.416133 m.416133 type:complete len:235 (-) comp29849_c0_seq1:29-733(-)